MKETIDDVFEEVLLKIYKELCDKAWSEDVCLAYNLEIGSKIGDDLEDEVGRSAVLPIMRILKTKFNK